MSGAWKITDDGEFVLDPAYDEKLKEIKKTLREGWLDTLCSELSACTRYERDELRERYLDRVEMALKATPEVVDSFIIEALEGVL